MSRAESPLARADLAQLFGPRGPIAAQLPGYEARPSQLQMAEAVRSALLSRSTALVEAPTGTGKSLAYLLPALLAGERVIVATANKSLQHQLYAKDVPLAGRILGREIDAVLVKGRSNYVCNWKWDREQRERSLLPELDADREQVQAIRQWLGRTDTGDVDDLPFLPGGDLRQRIVSFPDDCLHQDCEHAADNCWVNFMRDHAARAEVLITNHHLLLTALQLEEAGERILPAAPIYVIDEAHNLVDTATAVFEVEVTDAALPLLLSRKVYRDHIDEDVVDELRFEFRMAFDAIERLGDPAGRPATAFRIEEDLPALTALARRLKLLAQAMEDRNPYTSRTSRSAKAIARLDGADDGFADDGFADDGAAGNGSVDDDSTRNGAAGSGDTPILFNPAGGDPDKIQARIYEQAVTGLSSLADKLQAVSTSRHDGRVVRYAEPVFGRRLVRLAVHAAPIEPAALLGACLFDVPDRAVILTSATLAAGGGFAHLKARCGIETTGAELVAPPVFDYPSQALLYQPELPAFDWQNRDGYYAAVAEEIGRLIEVSRGRALCLFTSWSGLTQAQARLTGGGGMWPVRAQGDAPREALLAWFRDTPHSVLLATRSFWEGVDVPGDDLSLVVLDKLPFPTPSDPLHAARMRAIDEAGGAGSFGAYMLPLMSLTLKQGFGRLIRRASDRGVVAILDERLSRKGYGREVRRDLPPARYSRQFSEVHHFFREALATEADFALNVRAWVDGGDVDDPLVVVDADRTEGAPQDRSAARTGAASGPIHWRWQLCRLVDGKSDGDEGLAMDLPDRVAGEIHAATRGLENLRERIARAGREPDAFHVELRCSPETVAVLDGGHRRGAGGRGRRSDVDRARVDSERTRADWERACADWGGVSPMAVPPPAPPAA
jgi:ATP-dependent DNA helicase DinG